MSRRNRVIDPLITAIAATWLAGFGAASAAFAVRQRRSPVTWSVFGAILGPAALAILRVAPPGRCWSCEAPTQGWLTQCLWCGEDVHEPAPEVPEEEVLAPGPLIVIEGRAPRPSTEDAVGRRATDRAPHARPAMTGQAAPLAPARRALAALPSLPRIELPARAPAAEPERRAPAASLSLEAAPDPVRRLKASLGRSSQSIAAAEVAPVPVPVAVPVRRASAEPHDVVLASAIYVTGTRGLQAGSRYGIALFGYDLRILGPVDTDPTAVAILHSLRGVDATGLQGRLIITAGDGRRDRLALVFMAVAGGSPEGVADAIVQAATDLEDRLR